MVVLQHAATTESLDTPQRLSAAGVRSLLSVRTLKPVLLILAGAALIASIFLPYWSITLHAPQYPRGLYIDVYVNKMTPARNVREVDGLNHYIGMLKLTDAATLERTISRVALPLVALLALVSLLLRGAWRWIARLPVMLYPAIFAADLFGWLYYAGHSLDPHAPMSSSIRDFTPRIFGEGRIGQFRTEASFGNGFYLAVAAAVITLAVTMLDRRAQRDA